MSSHVAMSPEFELLVAVALKTEQKTQREVYTPASGTAELEC